MEKKVLNLFVVINLEEIFYFFIPPEKRLHGHNLYLFSKIADKCIFVYLNKSVDKETWRSRILKENKIRKTDTQKYYEKRRRNNRHRQKRISNKYLRTFTVIVF